MGRLRSRIRWLRSKSSSGTSRPPIAALEERNGSPDDQDRQDGRGTRATAGRGVRRTFRDTVSRATDVTTRCTEGEHGSCLKRSLIVAVAAVSIILKWAELH